MRAAFGRWNRTKAAAAVAGALAIGGAVGSAIAMSPTIAPPIKWQGGWEADLIVIQGEQLLSVVPAGRNLIITDLIVSNAENTDNHFSILTRPVSQNCSGFGGVQRLSSVIVPARGSANIALQTGIGVGSNLRICIWAQGEALLRFNARGFLFTAAPAS